VALLVITNGSRCEPSLSVNQFNISDGLDGFKDGLFGFLGLEYLNFNDVLDLLSSFDDSDELASPFNEGLLVSAEL